MVGKVTPMAALSYLIIQTEEEPFLSYCPYIIYYGNTLVQYKSYAQLQTNYLWSYGTLTGYPSLWSGMQIIVIDSPSVIT